MRFIRTLRGVMLGAAVLATMPRAMDAQQGNADVEVAGGAECPYSSCALGIAPRWNGLAVVRGGSGAQVTNLNFFLPRDITASLRGQSARAPGADSAAAHARRAIRLRWVGAALTDAGLVAGAVGAIGALRAGHVRRSDSVLLGAAGAALGISVPFQFAADGALSRAVWWHNRRYAR